MRITRIAAQVIAVAAVLWFAGRALGRQWHDVARVVAHLHIQWALVIAAALLIVASYLLLIELWRILLRASGHSVPFGAAARVWFVSSLGRYVPGKVWQLGAMGVMLQTFGVPVATSTAVALVNVLINTLAGFAVLFIVGARTLALPRAAIILLVVLSAGLAVMPLLLPRVATLYTRVTGRTLALERLSGRAVWLTAFGGAVQWCLYGVAFRLFAKGMLGTAPGPISAYVAAFTGSYLIGFLALFAPGGLVVRELVLAGSLTRLGLFSASDATVLAVTSRLWLTVLEVAPGLLLLARRRAPVPDAAPSSAAERQPSRARRIP
ncbi:MAG: lysylphosphatidylglycerol synthase domain-containing protein [Gemmatimonadaceae bacterium]